MCAGTRNLSYKKGKLHDGLGSAPFLLLRLRHRLLRAVGCARYRCGGNTLTPHSWSAHNRGLCSAAGACCPGGLRVCARLWHHALGSHCWCSIWKCQYPSQFQSKYDLWYDISLWWILMSSHYFLSLQSWTNRVFCAKLPSPFHDLWFHYASMRIPFLPVIELRSFIIGLF